MSRPISRGRGLSRDQMAQNALELMEELGEAGFSLRKLGVRLGCDPMSVLYHFGSKEGLLRAMADRMEATVRPAPADRPWRGRLHHLADQYRGLALRHPNTFGLMLRFLHTGQADFAHMEMVHGALAEAGLPDRDIPALCLGFYGCITGLALGEVAGLIRAPEAPEMGEIAALPDALYPRLKAALPAYRDLAPSLVFSMSVEALLDGLEVRAGR